MAISIEDLGIDRLSVGDRLELIEKIWNSLPENITAEEIPDWHLAEIAERRARLDSQPGLGRPWRDALQDIEGSE